MRQPACLARVLTLAFLAALLLGLPAVAPAQEDAQQTNGAMQWVEGIRTTVRRGTATLAQELDEFLSDREYEAEVNESRLALQFRTEISERDGTQFRVDPQVRLRLPNTERLIFIDVLGGGDRREADDPASGGISDPLRADEDGGVVQVRGVRQVGGVRVSPTAGLRFEGGDPRAFLGVRFSASRDLASGLQLFGSQRLIAYSDSVLEAITVLQADAQTSETAVLRGQLRLDWESERESFRYQPAVIWRWLANEKTVLSFENYLEVFSTPGDVPDNFISGVRVKRLLYEDWLFGEIRPWIAFERRSATSENYGAELLLEVNF